MSAQFQHNTVTCSCCGAQNNWSAGLTGGRRPQSGDRAVCVTCGEISVFVVGPLGMVLREATLDELAETVSKHGDLLRTFHVYRAQRPETP